MVVGENCAERAIDSGVVHQRIQIPALNCRLRTQPALALWPESRRPVVFAFLATGVARVNRTVENLRRRHFRFQRVVRIVYEAVTRAVVDRPDRFLHFLRTEGAVFVVETIARAVRRGDVKLHQVNMLAQDVGRCAHLEIVHQVIVWDQIGMPVFDDVARVAAEEQWLRLRGCLKESDWHLPTM